MTISRSMYLLIVACLQSSAAAAQSPAWTSAIRSSFVGTSPARLCCSARSSTWNPAVLKRATISRRIGAALRLPLRDRKLIDNNASRQNKG